MSMRSKSGGGLTGWIKAMVQEAPMRRIAQPIIKRFSNNLRLRELWDIADRPNYLHGVLSAADLAIREKRKEISVIEFGVAGGNGLLALESYADFVERETGVGIKVYGFDGGAGLPESTQDYRDHPDQWYEGLYPMDQERLRARLASRTELIIGNVRETVPQFQHRSGLGALGFISFDLDYYSSTRDAMLILRGSSEAMLRRVSLYFDDVDLAFCHRFAGELLAIDEFNNTCENVKIDRDRSIYSKRVFPEAKWLRKMYFAHNLSAITDCARTKGSSTRPKNFHLS